MHVYTPHTSEVKVLLRCKCIICMCVLNSSYLNIVCL